jgi:hypothetical protein
MQKRCTWDRTLHLAGGVLLLLPAGVLAQPNNNCASATNLSVPGSASGTTVGATDDGGASCGSADTSADVWYRVVIDAGQTRLHVDTCTGTFYDSVLSLHTACPGTSGNQLACNDDSCDLQSTIEATVTPGATYLIRVAGFGGATGSFTVTTSYPPPPTLGPDVIVGSLNSLSRYGATGGISAYSVGTTSCNIGDVDLLWISGNNQHPVIGQNMYRLKNGRIEQIGQSWLKHAFAAVNDGICGSCNGHLGQVLGVGCSDPYGSGLNGDQSLLGPRWQVNATTGNYPYPFFNSPNTNLLSKRLQVVTADIDPAQNAGGLYFAEGHYVTADDANANNGRNNATYRRITFASATATPAFAGSDMRQRPAIKAWKDNDPSVTEVDVEYNEGAIIAKFIVAAKATDNGNGTWSYEFAVYNHNSHRSGQAFSLPVPAGVSITNVGFHDVFYHSGDGINGVTFDGADWANSQTGGQLTWATSTFAQNQNANALRWGTMYNFRFMADTAPTTGAASLSLFRAGGAGEPDVLSIPGLPIPGGPSCTADWNDDGLLNSQDFFDFLNSFFANAADYNNDGSTNSQDFFDFLADFFAGC